MNWQKLFSTMDMEAFTQYILANEELAQCNHVSSRLQVELVYIDCIISNIMQSFAASITSITGYNR